MQLSIDFKLQMKLLGKMNEETIEMVLYLQML